MYEDLYHHGIKGMKWGIRRTPAQLGHKTSSKKKTSSKDKVDELTKKLNKYSTNFESSRKAREERKQAKEATKQAKEATKQAKLATKQAEQSLKKQSNKKPEKQKISELSDEELRERIARMELEKRYRDLNAANNPKSKKGKDIVNDLLYETGKDLTRQAIKHYAAKGFNKLAGEEAIFANNKKK